MKVPWGFAFFDVDTSIFRMPVNMIWAHFTHEYATDRVVYFLDLIKCDGKSALWSSSSCGDGVSFVDLVKEYSSRARRFIVEDEELRERIKSDLHIESINGEEDALREVAWGLRSGLPFIISEFLYDVTISPQRHLPLCEGFEVFMKKYQIDIPTEAVDEDFLTRAGTLQRIDELILYRCTEMREVCSKLVPGISGMIKDNFRYVEVMAKILTPWLVGEEWDSSKWSTAGEPWFTPDEMQKIVAKDAAADDAREKVKGDHKVAAMIEANLDDYRCLTKSHGIVLQKVRSCYEAKVKRGQKRSHTEMAEEEVVEAVAECRKGQDGADSTEEKWSPSNGSSKTEISHF